METQNSTNHQSLVPLSWSGLDNVQNVQSNIEPECPKSTEALSENRAANENFDARGKFAPGNCANPLGRPKSAKLVSDAIKDALADGKADEVKQQLFGLMESADKDSVRLAAISEIIDRSEGKPMQNIRHAGVFMVMAPSGEALAALDAWSQDE